MIEINYLYIDLLNSIKEELKENNYSKIELNILKSIFNIIKKSEFYIFNQHYTENIDLKKIDKKNGDKKYNNNFGVEINHYHFELLRNNTEIKHYSPLIYLYISEKSSIEEISKHLGIEIQGEFILLFRKVSNYWEIPIFGTLIIEKNNKKIVKNIEFIKNRFVKFEINSKQEDFERVVNELNYETFKKITEFKKVINSNKYDDIIIDQENFKYKTLNIFLQKETFLIDKETKREKTESFKKNINHLTNFCLKVPYQKKTNN